MGSLLGLAPYQSSGLLHTALRVEPTDLHCLVWWTGRLFPGSPYRAGLVFTCARNGVVGLDFPVGVRGGV